MKSLAIWMICVAFYSTTIYGQILDSIKFEKTIVRFDNNSNPTQKIIQIPTEEFVAVSKISNDKIGLTILGFDGTLQLDREVEIKGLENIASVNSLIWTFDGGILISGNIKEKRSFKAFIIKINLQGEALWSKPYLSEAQKREWSISMVQGNEKSILVFFDNNKETSLRRIDPWKGKAFEVEDNLSYKCHISSIQKDSKGNFLIAGEDIEERPYFLVIDPDGKKITERKKLFGAGTYGEAKSISINLKNGIIGLAGDVYQKGRDWSDIFIMFYTDDYKPIGKPKIFGKEREIEKVFTVFNDQKESFFLGGYYSRDHNRESGLLIQTDLEGEVIKRSQFRFENDVHTHIYNFITNKANELLGFGGSGYNDLQPTFFKIKQIKKDELFGKGDIQIGEIKWIEEFLDDTLKSSERSIMQFSIENSGNQPISLRARLEGKFSAYDLVKLNSFNLGYVPANSEKTFNLPLIAGKKTLSGNVAIKLVLENSKGEKIIEKVKEILIKRAPYSKIQFIDSLAYVQWKNNRILFNSNLRARRRDSLRIIIPVTNLGDLPSGRLRAIFYLPIAAQTLESTNEKTIPRINPRDTTFLEFHFKANSYYPSDSISVRLKILSDKEETLDYLNFILNVPNLLDITVLDNIPFIKNNRGYGGPHQPDPRDLIDPCEELGIEIAWIVPDVTEYEYGKGVSVNLDKLLLKAKIRSKLPLSINDIKLLIRGKELVHGVNQDTCFLSLLRDTLNSKSEEFPYLYEYQNLVWLNEGPNPYKLKVKENCETPFSVKIDYERLKVNLNVYSIGIPFPYKNLEETSIGSEKIFENYANMSFSFFDKKNKSNLFLKNTKEETEKGAISDFISKQITLFPKRKERMEYNMNIFYLASHMNYDKNGELRILCSNLEDPKKLHKLPSREVDRRTYRLKDFLDDLNCFGQFNIENNPEDKEKQKGETHTYLILEMCNSGDSVNINNWLDSIKNEINGSISVLATTSKSREAYICKKNQMPCGTCAINDAFKEENRNKADKFALPNPRDPKNPILIKNGDGFITIKELFEFLKERLPFYLNQNGILVDQQPHLFQTSPPHVFPIIFEFKGASGHLLSCGKNK